MDYWDDKDWFSGDVDLYIFYEKNVSTPIFSNSNGEWISDSFKGKEYAIAYRAPYMEIIAWLKTTVIIVPL